MKLMVFILDRVELLGLLLKDLASAGIKGATIIDSAGMTKTLARMEDSFLGASFKALFDSYGDDNLTILAVLKDSEFVTAKQVIADVIGDLSKPNTGLLFTVPIDYVDGLAK